MTEEQFDLYGDKPADDRANDPHRVSHAELKAYVERIERGEERKQAEADDIKAIYAEAKSKGYTVKVIRKLIARRKQDPDKLAEEDALLELYEGVFA